MSLISGDIQQRSCLFVTNSLRNKDLFTQIECPSQPPLYLRICLST